MTLGSGLILLTAMLLKPPACGMEQSAVTTPDQLAAALTSPTALECFVGRLAFDSDSRQFPPAGAHAKFREASLISETEKEPDESSELSVVDWLQVIPPSSSCQITPILEASRRSRGLVRLIAPLRC